MVYIGMKPAESSIGELQRELNIAYRKRKQEQARLLLACEHSYLLLNSPLSGIFLTPRKYLAREEALDNVRLYVVGCGAIPTERRVLATRTLVGHPFLAERLLLRHVYPLVFPL